MCMCVCACVRIDALVKVHSASPETPSSEFGVCWFVGAGILCVLVWARACVCVCVCVLACVDVVDDVPPPPVCVVSIVAFAHALML